MKALKHTIERYFPWILQLLRSAMKAPTFRYRHHRRPGSLDAEGGYTTGEGASDKHLIDRLVQSYSLRRENPSGQWSDIFLDRHADISEAFASRDRPRIEEILRNPASSDIFRLLSINHEANEFTVAQLIREGKHARASRMPYWMRRGFVEEVVEFAPPEYLGFIR
jgi:hypothetical protein